jgi:predicted ester cyclase
MTGAAETAMRRLWTLIDAQAWDELDEVLASDVCVSLVHSQLDMDRAEFVRFNREYPGRWHCEVVATVAEGDRVAARVRVFDDAQTFWVASFATVRDGAIVDITEVWTDAVVPAAQT